MPEFEYFKDNKNSGVCASCGCDDFSLETAEEIPMIDIYTTKGIEMDNQGDCLKLTYSGLLTENGAKEIYAVVSYGDNRKWNDVRYYPMNNLQNKTYGVLLPVRDNTNLNIAFKDEENNWDNNLGINYSFNLH
jgi:hypothetical protein